MLNTTNVASPTLAAPTAARPGGVQSAADDSTPFAQVLGQASAQQRAAAEDAEPGGAARASADAAGGDDAAPRSSLERRGTASPRGKVPGQTVTQEAKARPHAPREPKAEATDPPPQWQVAALDEADDEPPVQAPFDAEPRTPAGTLPPAPAVAAASLSPRCADATSPPGVAKTVAGESTPQPAWRALDVLARPEGSLPGVPAHAQAVGARPEGARVPGRDRHGAVDDAAASRDLAAQSRSAFESALQAAAPAQASLPAASAADSGDHRPAALPVAAWAATTTPSTAAPAPLQAELGVPPGSREFAPALGAQLAVLVRDGVEHAQLRLNPAELGPIDVRISVDGTQAQVDFAAAHVTTRHALQDAVPALAGALRESGLTLSGGGVFEQPREQRGDAHANAPQGDARAADHALDGVRDTGVGAALAARLPRARGVVDLYA